MYIEKLSKDIQLNLNLSATIVLANNPMLLLRGSFLDQFPERPVPRRPVDSYVFFRTQWLSGTCRVCH